MDNNLLTKLRDEQNKHKFSEAAWAKRNIAPSKANTNFQMNLLINKCIEEIIQTKANPTEQSAHIINRHISLIHGFDTEETEFLHAEFWKLAELLQVLPLVENFKDDYQFYLDNQDFNPNIHEEEVVKECSNCNITLKLIVLEKEAIPKVENGNLFFENDEDAICNVSCSKCKSIEQMRIPAFSFRMMYKNCLPSQNNPGNSQ